MDANSRIAVNTVILYTKLIITIIVNLYSTRLILNAMGVEDYGIVNLISGIVAMLSFLQNSMTVSTQRYLSVNIGRNDRERQKQIFNSSFFLHIGLAVFLLFVLELIQPLVFNSSVQIPVSRLSASQSLYQLTVIGTLLVVIGVPFDATLNAHENMLWFSIASILESLIRLSGALILLSFQKDKLVFYGILIVVIRLSSLVLKATYCLLNYPDSSISLKNAKPKLAKEMASFASWNIAGAFATAARSQGIAIILNVFNGVVINAAYGIANQVSGQLSNFTTTITKAMAPQIMQNRGSGNFQRMFSLAITQCKYSFILLLTMALPLFIDMPFILKLWLKEVPDHSIVFCRLIILTALAQQITGGMQTLIQANGRIAWYQFSIAFIMLINVPVAYLLMNYGMNPTAVLVSIFIIEICCAATRFVFAHRLLGLSYKTVFQDLLLPASVITIIAVLTCILVFLFPISSSPFIAFIFHCIISILTISAATFLTMSKHERTTVLNQISKVKTIKD